MPVINSSTSRYFFLGVVGCGIQRTAGEKVQRTGAPQSGGCGNSGFEGFHVLSHPRQATGRVIVRGYGSKSGQSTGVPAYPEQVRRGRGRHMFNVIGVLASPREKSRLCDIKGV